MRKPRGEKLLSAIEEKRLYISRNTEANKKSQLGQFLAPEKTAAFMASLFPDSNGSGLSLQIFHSGGLIN